MIQSQHTCSCQQSYTLQLERNPLLEQHPILVPLSLISSAIILIVASFFARGFSPTFLFIGISTTLLCLLLATVLGLCGVITGIIELMEHVDRSQTSTFTETKGQCNDRN